MLRKNIRAGGPKPPPGPVDGERASSATPDRGTQVVDHSAGLRDRIVRNLARVQTMQAEAGRHHAQVAKSAEQRAAEIGEEVERLQRQLAAEAPNVSLEDVDMLERLLYEQRQLLTLAARGSN